MTCKPLPLQPTPKVPRAQICSSFRRYRSSTPSRMLDPGDTGREQISSSSRLERNPAESSGAVPLKKLPPALDTEPELEDVLLSVLLIRVCTSGRLSHSDWSQPWRNRRLRCGVPITGGGR